MKTLFVAWWSDVRESYWFVPAIMATSAVILSFLTTYLDAWLGSAWMEDISWLYANKPEGARAVLSTVAGSMITVAGVTFSMTILSISYTTSQVGPRLLKNFMRDTSNQLTLGVFIATFLYCLMVLRTVQNADTPPVNGSIEGELASAFVPHIAIMVGLLLTIICVGMLIFFIHHIPESIHISNIVSGVGHTLRRQIDDDFPHPLDALHNAARDQKQVFKLPTGFYGASRKLFPLRAGYIEYIDMSGLVRLAKKHDLVLRLWFSSGDFVTRERPLLIATPAANIDKAVTKKLLTMFYCGSQRTERQNLRFVLNQLVEVAMRALSPGVNDPFTAMNCMDWLQSALSQLSTRSLPDALRYDDEHDLRLISEVQTFRTFVELVFDQLRPYAGPDRNAAIHLMRILATLSVAVSTTDQRRVIFEQARALRKFGKQALEDKRSYGTLVDEYERIIAICRDPIYRAHVRETGDWDRGRRAEKPQANA